MVKKNILFLFGLVIFIITLQQASAAVTNISSCQNITTSGLYQLNATLNSSETCIYVNSSNVSLDCRGYTINFSQTNNASTNYGIYMSGTYSNITLKNCIFEQGNTTTDATALYFQSITDLVIYNNSITLYSGAGKGIHINNNAASATSGLNITLNSLNINSSSQGIFLRKLTSPVISENSANKTGESSLVYLTYANYTLIDRNILNNKDSTGIYMIIEDYYTNITNNIIKESDASYSGIQYTGNYNTYIFNNTINSTGYGIYVDSDTNTSTLLNNSITSGLDPIKFWGGDLNNYNQTVTGNTQSSKTIYYYFNNDSLTISDVEFGKMLIVLSNNMTINNVTSSLSGIELAYTTNSTIKNSTITTAGIAIKIDINSSYNIIKENNLSSTTDNVVNIANTGNNTYNNITQNIINCSGTGYKAGVAVDSDYRNNVFNNTIYGADATIGFYLSGNYSQAYNNNIVMDCATSYASFVPGYYNIIYNNIFNATNYVLPLLNTPNYLNTTKTSTTNIVGKSYVGGNYYTNSSATGYSDTCTDADGDYICDTSLNHTAGTNNTDYLPLARLYTPAATTNPTTNNPGGSTAPTTEWESQKINSLTKITPDEPAVINNFDKEGIEQLEIYVFKEANNVRITVRNYNNQPDAVTVKQGKVYQYLQIETQNLEDSLESAKLTIKVNKTWLAENNIDKEDIVLSKFNEEAEEWKELSTNYLRSDENYDYFQIELTSFSYFAISEKEQNNLVEGLGTLAEKANSVAIGIALGAIAIIIIIVVIIKYKDELKEFVSKVRK